MTKASDLLGNLDGDLRGRVEAAEVHQPPEHPRADLLIDLDRIRASLDALAVITHNLVRDVVDTASEVRLDARPPGYALTELRTVTYLRNMVENFADQLNDAATMVGTFRDAVYRGAQEATP